MAKDGNPDTIIDPPASSGQEPEGTSGGDTAPATGGGGTPQAQAIQTTGTDGKTVSAAQTDPEFQGLIHRKKELAAEGERLSARNAFLTKQAQELEQKNRTSSVSPVAPTVKLSENLEPYKPELEALTKAYVEPIQQQLAELNRQQQAIAMSEWEKAQADDMAKTAQKYPDFWKHQDKMNELLKANPALYDIPKENLYKMAAFDATIEGLKTNGKAQAISDMQKSARQTSPSGSVSQSAITPMRGVSERSQLDADFNAALAEVGGTA